MQDNNNNNHDQDERLILPPPPPPIQSFYYTTPQPQPQQYIPNNNGYYETFDELFQGQDPNVPFISVNEQQINQHIGSGNDYTSKFIIIGEDNIDHNNDSCVYSPIIPPYQPYNDIAPTQEFVNKVAIRIREMEDEKNYREINENNNSNDHEEDVMDASMSMLILLLGMFFFIPFIFSLLYLKSKDKYARRFAILSICIGLFYLIMVGVPFFTDSNYGDDTTTTIVMN